MEIIKTKNIFYQYKIEVFKEKFNVVYRINIGPALIMSVSFYCIAKLVVVALNFNIPDPVLMASVPALTFASRKWHIHVDGNNLTRDEAISLIEKLGNDRAKPKV